MWENSDSVSDNALLNLQILAGLNSVFYAFVIFCYFELTGWTLEIILAAHGGGQGGPKSTSNV